MVKKREKRGQAKLVLVCEVCNGEARKFPCQLTMTSLLVILLLVIEPSNSGTITMSFILGNQKLTEAVSLKIALSVLNMAKVFL